MFDTLYAEGQRRYVETFSPYARQFLDRMDKPQVDRIEGIPPAIAIDQTNPVRTSRSTVGTMTEVNDHLKLMFARFAALHCQAAGNRCGAIRRIRFTSTSSCGRQRLMIRVVAITFPVTVPENFKGSRGRAVSLRTGYTRVHSQRSAKASPCCMWCRIACASVLREGTRDGGAGSRAAARQGAVNVFVLDGDAATWRYSADLHCAACDITYSDPHPSSFSFNNPLGACETCRGFGRVIGVDLGLVIPDEGKTLAEGGHQTVADRELQGMPGRSQKVHDGPQHPHGCRSRDLGPNDRRYVVEGDDTWRSWEKDANKRWYGVMRFFDWLESKAYKMHIRVLLSKYRAYTPCNACEGARLKPTSINFRLGSKANADAVLPPGETLFTPPLQVCAQHAGSAARPHHSRSDAVADRTVAAIFATLDFAAVGAVMDEAGELVLGVRSRLGYLCDVGLRLSDAGSPEPHASGGEVQRINLTTALGTSLTNTLFVLDEPSIGLHPRDMTHHWRHAAAQDRRQYAGGRRTRSADHVRGGSTARCWPRPRRARRPHHLRRRTARAGKHAGLRTAAYLLGRERLTRTRRILPSPRWGAGEGTAAASSNLARTSQGHPQPSPLKERADRITLTGARENNLKGIDVQFRYAGWSRSPASPAPASRAWCRTFWCRRYTRPRARLPMRGHLRSAARTPEH